MALWTKLDQRNILHFASAGCLDQQRNWIEFLEFRKKLWFLKTIFLWMMILLDFAQSKFAQPSSPNLSSPNVVVRPTYKFCPMRVRVRRTNKNIANLTYPVRAHVNLTLWVCASVRVYLTLRGCAGELGWANLDWAKSSRIREWWMYLFQP